MRALGTLLAVVVLSGAEVARAQVPDQADLHFDEGVRLFRREEYRDALREFEAARSIRETAGAVLNVAGCLRALFRYSEARAAYARYLELGGSRITRRQRSEVEAAIAELSRHVSEVTIQTNIPGAELFVDGRPVQHRPLEVDVDTDIVVEARRTGYQPARVSTRPTRAGPFTVALRLDPVTRPGRILVYASVPSAAVRVDGRDVGTAPWTGDLAPGEHRVAVRAVGYLEDEETIEVRPGDDLRHEVRLVPSVAPRAQPTSFGAPTSLARHGRRSMAGGTRALPWILAGAGLLAVAGSVVAAVLLTSEPLEGDWNATPP